MYLNGTSKYPIIPPKCYDGKEWFRIYWLLLTVPLVGAGLAILITFVLSFEMNDIIATVVAVEFGFLGLTKLIQRFD
jgi:hypothetical protein